METFQWIIVAVLMCLPILYELSNTFKYYTKFILYYTLIQLMAFIILFVGLCRPKDVDNYRYVQAINNFVMKIFALKMEIRGLENTLSDKPLIVVCNHQSSIDVIPMMKIWPTRCTGLAKKELLYAGVFGITAWLCGTIFIDRLSPEKARNTMVKTAKRIVDSNVKVWIYPEGTRNKDGAMLPFKKGAFHLAVQAQVPIVPVVFSSYSHFMDKSEKRFNTGKILITCLPPISTVGLETSDVPDLTERVRKLMVDAFNSSSLEVSQEVLRKSAAPPP